MYIRWDGIRKHKKTFGPTPEMHVHRYESKYSYNYRQPTSQQSGWLPEYLDSHLTEHSESDGRNLIDKLIFQVQFKSTA